MTDALTPATFHVTAIWDPEAAVYYSDTDVPGLVVEAPTLPEFFDLAQSLAAEVLAHNRPDITGPVAIRYAFTREIAPKAA